MSNHVKTSSKNICLNSIYAPELVAPKTVNNSSYFHFFRLVLFWRRQLFNLFLLVLIFCWKIPYLCILSTCTASVSSLMPNMKNTGVVIKCSVFHSSYVCSILLLLFASIWSQLGSGGFSGMTPFAWLFTWLRVHALKPGHVIASRPERRIAPVRCLLLCLADVRCSTRRWRHRASLATRWRFRNKCLVSGNPAERSLLPRVFKNNF